MNRFACAIAVVTQVGQQHLAGCAALVEQLPQRLFRHVAKALK